MTTAVGATDQQRGISYHDLLVGGLLYLSILYFASNIAPLGALRVNL